MSFASITFIFYFLPATLILYLLCSFSRVMQNLCLLVASLVFYSLGEPLYLLFLIATILINYSLGMLLSKERSNEYKKRVIWLTAILNISVLLLGRYIDVILFFIENFFEIQLGFAVSGSALGVAFFTLQAMGYVFDCSREKADVDKNFINVGLYIAFFPTVLAGPILHFKHISDQLKNRKVSAAMFGKGCARFVIGLGKQVLIASSLGLVANDIFGMSAGGGWLNSIPVLMAWLGLISYGLWLYFMLSGFADMAVGMAAMFGFYIKENFNYPFAAKSITYFWNRCHISLFNWVKRYVYIPLGGSRPQMVLRKGKVKPHNFLLRNLTIMWLLIGVWHGIGWTYFAWGIWFLFFYLFEWIIRSAAREKKSPLWHLYTLIIVFVSFIFLRCATFNECLIYTKNLLGFSENGFYNDFTFMLVKENWLPFLLAVVFATPLGRAINNVVFNEKHFVARIPLVLLYYAGIIAIFCLSVIYISKTGPVPVTIF